MGFFKEILELIRALYTGAESAVRWGEHIRILSAKNRSEAGMCSRTLPVQRMHGLVDGRFDNKS